ncbi:MAG: LytR/AlgR family response regulator transcription factor [Bacteroidota bacterium]
MNAIIIDDEKDARTGLRSLLNEYCPEVHIVAEASSAIEGIKLIRQYSPELVFLDIQMPGGTGFDMLDAIPEKKFKVIFTTAYDKHALKAIKNNPVDYLLKPIDPDELMEAIGRYIRFFSNEDSPAIAEPEKKPKVRIAANNNIILANADDIVHIEADGRYSKIFLITGLAYFVTKNLGELEEELETYGHFFRLNRSALINLHHVKQIIRKDGGYAELINSKQIEISRRKKAEFLLKINIA